MKHTLVVVAVALLGLAWVVWGPHSEGEPPGGARLAPQGTSGPGDDRGESVTLEVPEEASRTGEARAAVESSVPTGDAQSEPAPPAAADGELLVRVVDRDGGPVGNVPVELVLTSTMHRGELSGTGDALSESDGYALLKDCAQPLQAKFRPDEAPGVWQGIELELGVRTKLPFAEDDDRAIVVWLEAEPSAGEAVELVLPPHGWIDLSIEPAVDEVGVPLVPDHVVVRRADSGFYPGWRQGIRLDTERATHRLGPLGLGWEVSLSLSRSQQIGRLAAESVLGPTAHGQVVPVTVRTAGARTVTARALLPGGEPAADLPLHLELENPSPRGSSTTRLNTDADGRFTAWLPRELEATELLVRCSQDPLEHSARASLAPLLAGAQSLDLGELILQPAKPPARLIVDGQVTDAGGAPIRHVWVSAYEVTPDSVAQQALARTRTDAEGRYEIDSADPVPSGLVEIWVRHDEYLRTEGTQVSVGTTDLLFRLVRGATLSFAVDAEQDPLRWTQLLVRLKGPDTSRRLALGEVPGDRETGRRLFTGLGEGHYHLKIEIRKTDWVLHEIDGTLGAGGELDLGDVDLTGRTQALRLEVVDASGAPVAKAYFELKAPDGRGYDSLITGKDGGIHCLVPTDVGELALGSSEHGRARVTPGPEPVRVMLAK